MPSRYTTPPLSLSDYSGSLLRMKMNYISALLRWAITWLNGVQDIDTKAALEGLAQAKQVRRQAGVVESILDEAAVAAMYHDNIAEYRSADFGAVLHEGGARKRWRHEAVMEDLIEGTVSSMKGRFPSIPHRMLDAIVRESMWSVHRAGRIEWRADSLRAAGVDPDKHSSKGRDKPSIDLRGRAAYANQKGRPRGIR